MGFVLPVVAVLLVIWLITYLMRPRGPRPPPRDERGRCRRPYQVARLCLGSCTRSRAAPGSRTWSRDPRPPNSHRYHSPGSRRTPPDGAASAGADPGACRLTMPKTRLVIAGMRLIAALGPHARQLNGATQRSARGGIARALVELHADIGAEFHGDFHVVLGRPKHVAAVVIVDDKAHALIGELDGIVVAEDLETARVGEDGAVPVHELVQAAQLGDGILAGTHGQMIGIGEHDLGAELLDSLGRNALDVCLVPTA